MRINGLTLIELLFTLTLSSVIVLCSIASWSHFKQKNEKEILIAEIKNIIFYAKMRALNEGRAIVLSSKNEDKLWSKGFVLYSMPSRDTMYQWDMKYSNWTLEWLGVNGSQEIVFSGTTRAMSNGAFTLTNKHTEEKVVLTLNKLARMKQT
jgi:Tfp pilus assembly protein FimT